MYKVASGAVSCNNPVPYLYCTSNMNNIDNYKVWICISNKFISVAAIEPSHCTSIAPGMTKYSTLGRLRAELTICKQCENGADCHPDNVAGEEKPSCM